MTADQATIQSLDNAYWTARETSRLDEFSYNDARRTGILANLTAKGVDVTSAQQIETQIQALQPGLKAGLDARDDAQLKTVNSQIDTLCQQLAQQIVSISWQARQTPGSHSSIIQQQDAGPAHKSHGKGPGCHHRTGYSHPDPQSAAAAADCPGESR